MVTRIFLCSERTEPEIRTFIQEAMEDIGEGERYIITWSCGNVQTVKVGDRAYFKRIGSPVQGYFACGQVVAADPEYQLRLKSNRYRELSEAYDVDMSGGIMRVWVAWDSCVDFDTPLSSMELRQLPQFQGLPLEPQTDGGVFREEYVRLLDREWDRYSLQMAKTGKGIRLLDVYYRWGKEDMADGAWEDAINSFTQVIRLRPNFVRAYLSRAEVFMSLKKYQEAIADLGQAIYLNPNKAKEAYYKRGLAYLQLRQHEQALSDLQAAIELDPQYLEALLALANAYFKLNSYEQAISYYTQIIDRDPSFGNALYRRGRCYFVLKEFDHAIQDFNQALELEAGYAPAYYYRGLVQAQAGNPILAKADLQKAAKLYADQGKSDKARQTLEMMETLVLEPEPIPTATKNLPERKVLQITDQATVTPSNTQVAPTPEPQILEKEKLVVINLAEHSPRAKAAIVAVTSHYAQAGWQVRPVDSITYGYDLLCERDGQQEQVLIKEVSDPAMPFILSNQEINAAKTASQFVLWTVSQGEEQPQCQRWTGAEILAKFNLEPVEYALTPKPPEDSG
ncbi:MAG: tetratricopeptide repeat protein [Pseudanabaenaceae cyanobacterium]